MKWIFFNPGKTVVDQKEDENGKRVFVVVSPKGNVAEFPDLGAALTGSLYLDYPSAEERDRSVIDA